MPFAINHLKIVRHKQGDLIVEKRHLSRNRKHLEKLLAQVDGTANSLSEEVGTASGRQDGGNLSDVPLHLGDLGTEAYTQELNTVLLENTALVRSEIVAALKRIRKGSYGICSRCHAKIPKERLDAIPYARHCTDCEEKLASPSSANLNDGRPRSWEKTVPAAGGRSSKERLRNADQASFSDAAPSGSTMQSDRHAAGTPGGDSAVGGLGGTNVGDGDPDDLDLEDAMGSGEFDVEIEGNEEETGTYSGSSGGAVGGTPAGKRSVGGRK
jgi:RNA polymerase-binding transcription factor DksA